MSSAQWCVCVWHLIDDFEDITHEKPFFKEVEVEAI